MSPNADMAGKPTILVIDDEEVVRLLFQSLLEEEGYPTLMADSGQDGIRLLEQHKPPLALVDKNLPDISGLDLIAEQKRIHPDTEFIMITGYASLDSAVKAMEMGAFSYLTKPFSDMDMVMDRIRAALEVNTLRFETSLLRNRLNNLIEEPPAVKTTATTNPQQLVKEQVRHTVRLLESFVDKREQPPTAAVWARLVDIVEEESRKLKLLVQRLDELEG